MGDFGSVSMTCRDLLIRSFRLPKQQKFPRQLGSRGFRPIRGSSRPDGPPHSGCTFETTLYLVGPGKAAEGTLRIRSYDGMG